MRGPWPVAFRQKKFPRADEEAALEKKNGKVPCLGTMQLIIKRGGKEREQMSRFPIGWPAAWVPCGHFQLSTRAGASAVEWLPPSRWDALPAGCRLKHARFVLSNAFSWIVDFTWCSNWLKSETATGECSFFVFICSKLFRDFVVGRNVDLPWIIRGVDRHLCLGSCRSR